MDHTEKTWQSWKEKVAVSVFFYQTYCGVSTVTDRLLFSFFLCIHLNTHTHTHAHSGKDPTSYPGTSLWLSLLQLIVLLMDCLGTVSLLCLSRDIHTHRHTLMLGDRNIHCGDWWRLRFRHIYLHSHTHTFTHKRTACVWEGKPRSFPALKKKLMNPVPDFDNLDQPSWPWSPNTHTRTNTTNTQHVVWCAVKHRLTFIGLLCQWRYLKA